MGLWRAGFTEIVGVDIERRDNYPFKFIQADALEYLVSIIFDGSVKTFDLIQTGPPCQEACTLTRGTNAAMGWGKEHTQFIPELRQLLELSGVPYIIEQPNGSAPVRKDITLCGEMFGLEVLRHRNFELGGWSTAPAVHIKHRGRVRGWRHGEYFDGPYVAVYGKGGGKASVQEAQRAMEIYWTDRIEELTEAIPPAYYEWLGMRFWEWKVKNSSR